MCESRGSVQITQGIEFPAWLLHEDEELLNPFKRKLPCLHKNFDGVAAHDLLGHVTEGVFRNRG